MAKRKTRDTPASDAAVRERIVSAAMQVFAVQGWNETRLSDIAEEAGLTLSELQRHCRSKLCVVALFSQEMDQAMLAGDDPAIVDEPLKDRLFDVMMRRLEAMKPHRAGVSQVIRGMRKDPAAAAFLAAGPMRQSLDWMLEAARVPSWGPLQPLQRKGLGLLYLKTLNTWLKDEGADLGKTMAALDKDLKRVDSFAGRLAAGPFGRRREPNDESASAAEDR